MTRRSNLIPRLADLKNGATPRRLTTILRFEACHSGTKPDRSQDHFEKVYRQWRRTREVHEDPDPVQAATTAALKYIRKVRKIGNGRCCPICP